MAEEVKGKIAEGADALKNLRGIEGDPVSVSVDLLAKLSNPDDKVSVLTTFFKSGAMQDDVDYKTVLSQALAVDTRRRAFYKEVRDSCIHPYVAGALELYVDSCTGRSAVTGRSVWCTSEDKKVQNEANQMLLDIRIDDVLRDWAMRLARDGDFFIKPQAEKGLGVMFVDDTVQPEDMERIDINGRLEGFVNLGRISQQSSAYNLEAPWEYVHFRIFGGTPTANVDYIFGNLGSPDRHVDALLQVHDKRLKITTKYGVSMLAPSQSTYKRLKLAEDSVMMSRLTRGILWYLYRVKVNSSTPAQALQLVKSVRSLIKRKAAMNTTSGSESWQEKFAPIFGQVEDVFVPETDTLSVSVDKMGGEPDIRALFDVEMLENRLLGSLRVSRIMLGLTDSTPGSFGESAASRISVNFAKTGRRLEDALRSGICRLIQIHLAYKGLNADPSRFQVEFAGISSAEDEETKSALDKTVDIVDKTMASFENAFGDKLKKQDLYIYLVTKFMKFDDLDFSNVVVQDSTTREALVEVMAKKGFTNKRTESFLYNVPNADLFEKLPDEVSYKINESDGKLIRFQHDVATSWVGKAVVIKDADDV